MKKETRALSAANNNPRNPRKISTARLDQLDKSLAEYGDLGGVVLNLKTGHFVGGHQRIASFKQAEVPAVIEKRLAAEDATGTVSYGYIEMHGTRFAYREVNWPESKELAANIAANNNGGEFVESGVREILRDLDAQKVPLYTTGFSETELERLLKPPSTGGGGSKNSGNRQSDDEYCLFELVMLNSNKQRLSQILDEIRQRDKLETIEEALMRLCDLHKPTGKPKTKTKAARKKK